MALQSANQCNHMTTKTWYKRARELMKDLGISQDDVADYMKITRPAVGHWLSGRREPNIENIIRLSEMLRTSTDYLLKGKKSSLDMDDIDRKVIGLMDELSPTQIARLIEAMEKLVAENYEIRHTPKRTHASRINKPTMSFGGS